jgi:hypothetical protein
VGIVMGSTVIFFYLLWNHKQRIKIIEKGTYKKSDFDIDVFSILSGLILSSLGVSLVVFFLIKEGFTYGVLSGLIPLAIGISFIIFFILRLKFFRQ